MISRTRGGPKRDSDIIQSDVTDLWGFVGLIFREVVSSFQESIGPVRIKHDVIVHEWSSIMSGRVCVDV